MKITFEKDSPEEKAEKKAKKKAKMQKKYGHLAKAEDGSLAKFISDRFTKNQGSKRRDSKSFTDDSHDFDFLKEAEDGSAVKYVEDLMGRMFPNKKDKKKKGNKKNSK
ncbi:TPA_asm: hypothetical protein GZX72_14365 [Listeria monocytogenes]|nr:hypothetical protein [Listeria monocytogenes]